MEYQIEETYLTIFLPEEVDHHATEEIRSKTDWLVDQYHIRDIIFDFQKTGFMDSSGIGAILGRYRHISLVGGAVWAANPNPRMRKIMEMSGITGIVKIIEEENQDE